MSGRTAPPPKNSVFFFPSPVANFVLSSLSGCGQTLNNDGLLSGWFNDEDCLPSLRERCLFLEPVTWLGQSHMIVHQLSPNVNPLDTGKGQNKHWAEFTLCLH